MYEQRPQEPGSDAIELIQRCLVRGSFDDPALEVTANDSGDDEAESLAAVQAWLERTGDRRSAFECQYHQLREVAERSLAEAPSGSLTRSGPKVGRNQACPCGSGKKHKRCCGRG